MDSNRTDDELQARFESQAEDLGLQPEEEKAGWGEERTVGLAAGMHTVVETEPDESRKTLSDEDRHQIEGLIRRYTSLHPHEFLEEWRSIATDPFVVFGFGYVVQADEDTIADWKEKHLEKALGEHYHDPRRVEVSELSILDLGIARAGATYHLAEEYTDGSTESGQQMAILMCVEGEGWRIVGVTKSHHSTDELKDIELYEQHYRGDGDDDSRY